MHDKAAFYNASYQRKNYFHYQTWIYGRYISGLIAFSGLKKGASVLDVGCGQGLFSHLFAKRGMKVHGIDISESGIDRAKGLYGGLGITFAVADIQTEVFREQFDCIFVRSCSLYNTDAFPFERGTTDRLLRQLKDNGILIFAYNSNLSSEKSSGWRYHSLRDVQQHFGAYHNAEVFFVNRVGGCILGKRSFTPFLRRLNILLSQVSTTGGDLLCFLRKPASLTRK